MKLKWTKYTKYHALLVLTQFTALGLSLWAATQTGIVWPAVFVATMTVISAILFFDSMEIGE